MDDLRRRLEEFGKKLQEKQFEYQHKHGKLPDSGPAARLHKLQQAQADLLARAQAVDAKGWEATKKGLEEDYKALQNDFSSWVALIDAEYNNEI